jgi:tRNA dimethylallyltransferase
MNVKSDLNLIVILGPTASGKTRLGARLAREIGSEVISADSRQVYRGMDIGTGKDLDDYIVDGFRVPYHLIDIADPADEFSVYDYQQAFYRSFEELRSRGLVPVLVGGTGMYMESVLLGYDMPHAPVNRALRAGLEGKSIEELIAVLKRHKPGLHNTSDFDGRERIIRAIEIAIAAQTAAGRPEKPQISACVFGTAVERGRLRKLIAARLRARIDSGLIEEVKRLREAGLSWERLDAFGLEYRYVSRFLKGEMDREGLISILEIRIGQFAKRQMTWFRRMEKRGIKINWIAADDPDAIRLLISC